MYIIDSFKGWICNDITKTKWVLQSTTSVNPPSKGEKIISHFSKKWTDLHSKWVREQVYPPWNWV